MTTTSFTDVAARLPDESLDLFAEMVVAHLEAGRGDKIFIRSDTMAGRGLMFRGGPVRRQWRDFDGGSLDDLSRFGLLHVGYNRKGTENYRVSADGLAFYKWRLAELGQPIAQVEDEALKHVTGEDFAVRHPDASHHLREAFGLLAQDSLRTQVISEIGDHLRKAIMDSTTTITGDYNSPEKPITQLATWIEAQTGLSEREQAALAALVTLLGTVLRLDHRLNHVRDEVSKERSEPSFSEVRRAAFMTAFACFELDRASQGR